MLGSGSLQGADGLVEGAAGGRCGAGEAEHAASHLPLHRQHQQVRLLRQHGAHYAGPGEACTLLECVMLCSPSHNLIVLLYQWQEMPPQTSSASLQAESPFFTSAKEGD